MSALNKVEIGAAVPKMLANDLIAEGVAVKGYNESIRQAVEVGDNGTGELLEAILEDEENHVDEIEAQLEQIKQMGVQNYLVQQIH